MPSESDLTGRVDRAPRSDVQHLQLAQAAVESVAFREVLVSALLDDLAVVHEHDPVRTADRRHAVRAHQRRPAFEQAIQGLLDLMLRFRVQRARRLVEHDRRKVSTVARSGAGRHFAGGRARDPALRARTGEGEE